MLLKTYLDIYLLILGFQNKHIDKALPIENDQTISQPYTVAFQTQLNPSARDKILEIGTGSGYQTAILDYLNLDIFTIERDHALYRSTSNLFDRMKIKPKKFIYGDGFNGMQDYSPFDGKIVTAGTPVIPKKPFNAVKNRGSANNSCWKECTGYDKNYQNFGD